MREPQIGDKFSCYDEETEILTFDGWKYFKDLKLDDKVATLANENELLYEKPSELHQYEFDGLIYHVESNHVDLKVTPNHMMYVRSHHNNSKYKLIKAEDISGEVKRYKKNCDYYNTGKTEDKYFTIPAYKDKPALKVPMKEWLLFFGIWMAQGCMTRDWSVTFSAHRQRVKDELDKISVVMGFDIVKHKDRSEHVMDKYNYKDPRLINFFAPLSVEAVNKYLPDWVWNLSTNQCQYLIHGMCLGDGHTMKNGTRQYDTSSKRLANDFQRLCLHAGICASMNIKYKAFAHTDYNNVTKRFVTNTHDVYRLTLIEKHNEPIINKYMTLDESKKQDKWVNYKGNVYCCTVTSGLLFVRRNMKIVVSGNSRNGQKVRWE